MGFEVHDWLCTVLYCLLYLVIIDIDDKVVLHFKQVGLNQDEQIL